jgi:short-subunit dehydrogenase
MKIAKKTFIITGAGSGIGKALTKELLKKNAKVVAVDLKKASLNKLAKELEDLSKNFYGFALDVSDKKAVERFAKTLEKKKIKIDVLVNNAGIIQPFVKLNNLDYEAIERIMNVNFYGPLYLIKAFLPQLLKRKEGYIVNVSSMGAFAPVPGQTIYGASKAALKLLSEGLWSELYGSNIKVLTVFPGATKTNIAQNSNVQLNQTENNSRIPMLTAEKVAKLIVEAIEKNKSRLCTGKDSKMMDFLSRIAPLYAAKVIAKNLGSLLQNNKKEEK